MECGNKCGVQWLGVGGCVKARVRWLKHGGSLGRASKKNRKGMSQVRKYVMRKMEGKN